jgi:hypothetical protein
LNGNGLCVVPFPTHRAAPGRAGGKGELHTALSCAAAAAAASATNGKWRTWLETSDWLLLTGRLARAPLAQYPVATCYPPPAPPPPPPPPPPDIWEPNALSASERWWSVRLPNTTCPRTQNPKQNEDRLWIFLPGQSAGQR